jgi:hypothetical protein
MATDEQPSIATVCVCGHVYVGYPNWWGKICIKCDSFIPPTRRPKLVEEGEMRKKHTEEQIRASIRKKFGLLVNQEVR